MNFRAQRSAQMLSEDEQLSFRNSQVQALNVHGTG